MRSKAICLALLAFAFGAQARPVVDSEVSRAARAWARTSQAAARVTAHRTDANVTFFAVKLADGGTVFLAGDTERRPVIAYVTATNDFASIDRSSPLWALLNRDQAAVISAQTGAGTGASATGGAASAAESEWATLLAGGEAVAAKTAVELQTTHVEALTDVRAGPLVKSAWDQDEVGGKTCYNYYTPKLSDGSRAVCGCVATAMAQVMRYHRYPTQSVSPVTRKCTVQASTKSQSAATVSLTTQGGVYDWANMALVPTSSITEAQRQAIGRLTSDAGISVFMNYDTIMNGGSGAFMFNVVNALKGVFGYASACFYTADEVTKSESTVRNAMLSNFDAGYPVLMGIAGDGGHAIVGDGYGYKGDKLYVHLNMGWSGQDNVWYNLPDIDTSYYKFNVFDDLVYNIFPKSAGGLATLSGRAVDDEGVGQGGLSVTVRRSGGTETVATSETTAGGVYGLRVPAGTYDVEIKSAESGLKETLTGVAVSEPKVTTTSFTGWICSSKDWRETYTGIPVVTSVGNRKEADNLVLYAPTVRIGENTYSRLDKALADAKAIYAANPTEPVAVEVIADTELRKTVAIDFPCVLTSADPSAMAVFRTDDARLAVSENGELAVADIVFDESVRTLVEVADGGLLTVGAGVDFGVPDTTAAVRVQKAEGFILTGEPAEWFSVDCASALSLNEVFGYAAGDFASVSGWASKFVNLNDPNGELAGAAVDGGSSPYALRWELLPVPLEDAVAYYVLDGEVETNCFRRLDRLAEIFGQANAAGEIVIRKDATLSRRLTLKDDLRLTSSAGAKVSCSGAAGFTVGAGLSFVVDGVSFDGASGDSLFVVEGGALTLGGTMAVENFTGTAGLKSAAVRVTSGGSVVVGSASGAVTFANCRNTYGDQSTGGAICAADAGTTVDLGGEVSVTGCHSRGTGGGIHVAKNVRLSLSGRVTIRDNTSGNTSPLASDVYCASASAVVEVAGLLETGSSVGIRKVASGWNTPGSAFATTAGFIDPVQVYDSSRAFFCDGSDGLRAEPNAAFDAFVWVDDAGGVEPVDPSVATVRVLDADGTEVGYYGSFEDAMAVLDGASGMIELQRDTAIVSNVTVTSALALKSASGGPFTLSRAAQCEFEVVSGGSLTVSDLTVSGAGAQGRLFLVDGGELILSADATVRDVTGGVTRNDAAVKVADGGRFVMKAGSRIADCENPFVSGYTGNGRGGAVSADDESVVRLEGGVIEDCSANLGAGVFIGNRSAIEVGGTATVTDNGDAEGVVGNVYVPAYCELRLIAPLSGAVGVTQGQTADPVVFGRVADEYAGTDAELADSAHRFANDGNGDIGFAVRNGDETLLVWSDGLNLDGNYVDANGKTYVPVAGGEAVPIAPPTAVAGLAYNGGEQVGVIAGHGYGLSGNVGTHADSYAAAATLKAGFAWEDGSPETVRTINWSIAPAPLRVTAHPQTKYVDEPDPELTYTVSGLQGKDSATTVLSGSLAHAQVTGAGTYAITQGSLTCTADYAIDYVGSTLTVITRPMPEPPATNYPTPIAFQSIVQNAAGQWTLVVTNGVKDCWYSLWGSAELGLGTFKLIERRQADADGPVTFEPANVQPTDGKWFWQARGEPGEVRE